MIIIIIIYVYMCAPACLCVHHVHAVSVGARVGPPRTGGAVRWCRCWITNLGHLQEHRWSLRVHP